MGLLLHFTTPLSPELKGHLPTRASPHQPPSSGVTIQEWEARVVPTWTSPNPMTCLAGNHTKQTLTLPAACSAETRKEGGAFGEREDTGRAGRVQVFSGLRGGSSSRGQCGWSWTTQETLQGSGERQEHRKDPC